MLSFSLDNPLSLALSKTAWFGARAPRIPGTHLCVFAIIFLRHKNIILFIHLTVNRAWEVIAASGFMKNWTRFSTECRFGDDILGVERNRKQRNPVNSITSSIVSGTLLCTGSTGPFIAIGSLKDFFSSCKEEKFPRQDIRYYLKYVCKEEGRNTGVTRIFCRHVMIENRYLK